MKYLDYEGLQFLVSKIKSEKESTRSRIPGLVFPYAGTIAPVGYLMCDGAQYSTDDYPELYEAIGRTYTAADAEETVFNVPNLIGRVPIGSGSYSDSTTGETATHKLGATGGEVEHELTVEELPNHVHNIQVYQNTWTDSLETFTNAALYGNYGTNGIRTANQLPELTGTGGDQTHNNMPPYLVTNYIISTGKKVESSDVVTDDDLAETPLPISKGGTSATTAAQALVNLGITYGTEAAPSTGTPGSIYIQIAEEDA